MGRPTKAIHTIGCCGIDCGLCPRSYTDGASRCPGCGAPDFYDKHPACGFLTCCAAGHGAEVCAACGEFPCKRFDGEAKGVDSFVTHQKVFENQRAIQENGMDEFLRRQRRRMDSLAFLLGQADDGRSKSFYCLSCALLPLDALEEAVAAVKTQSGQMEQKELCRVARERLQEAADRANVVLVLRKSR